MATVKLVLRKHYQKKDGSYPLVLRITKDRKARFVFTGKYLLEKDWDEKERRVKKSHPNSTRLNNLLLKKLSEAQATILDDEASDNDLSTKEIQKKVKGKGKNVSFFQLASKRVEGKYNQGTFSVAKPELSILHNIQEFINLPRIHSQKEVIAEIKQRRKDRISKGRKNKHFILSEIKMFAKNTSLNFEDIDTVFLDKYKMFCATYLGQQKRTITNQLIFIRTLFNRAIKEGLVEIKHYPFAKENEKIRIGSGHKIGLTIEEIEKIEAIQFEKDTPIWHTKNVWLVAFYFAGIRISDVLELKWSDFKNDRLFYIMNKNEKPISLKIPDKVKSILAHYEATKKSKNAYVFPFLSKANKTDSYDIFVKTRNATSLFNRYLKRIAKKCEIDKNLSNHIARHSFGNIAGDAIHPLMLQKLYRHSDLKTTINYQANFIHKEADDALDAVINF